MNTEAADWSKIGGYVKLSASLNCAGETPVELQEDPNPMGSQDCVMPDSIQPKFKQLIMNLYHGEHLPKLDKEWFKAGGGKMDAYCKTKIGNR
jgi:hypothetical protein